MSERLDLPQTETLLRAHYAQTDPGSLRPAVADRIRARLEAEQRSGMNGSPTRLRLEPVRGRRPSGRQGLGWPLAVAAVVALLVVTWLAAGRLSAPPVAGSPSAPVSSGASAPVIASGTAPAGSAVPSVPSGSVVPSPAGAATGQTAMAFSDRQHGIVVGSYQGQGAVWRTADEGQTWTSTLVPTSPLDSVAVLGTHAWASASCAGVDGACTPVVITSDDSGATWSVISSTPVASLSFVSAAHGFAVAAPPSINASHLIETTDGGRTWTRAAGADPCETYFGPVSVSFADAQHGWVACSGGEGQVGQAAKEVVATGDGGATWTVRSRVHPNGMAPAGKLPSEGTFRGIQMLSSGTGITWLWNEGILRTTDGGVTWGRLPLGDVAGDLQWPGAAITPDGSLFALTVNVPAGDTEGTFNLGLSDGRDWKPYTDFAALPAPGTTPAPEPTAPPQPAIADSGVAFFDATNGIAIGNGASNAYEWRTADGGKTWTTSALKAPSAKLLAANGSRVWISTSSCVAYPADPTACTSAIERSDDRGATWTSVGSDRLTAMSFGDATHGFGVGPMPGQPSTTMSGSGGGIYATADGGATWKALADPRPCGTFDPMSVSFVSAVHGWLGCSGAMGAGQGMKAVLETTDGGRTWTVRARVDIPSGKPTIGSITTSDYLGTISMQGDGSGFMTGVRGSTFRTNDGGRTWTDCPPGEFDAFNTSQAAIVPGGPWFVIQTGWITQGSTVMQAGLMRSDNRGATWTQVGAVLPNP